MQQNTQFPTTKAANQKFMMLPKVKASKQMKKLSVFMNDILSHDQKAEIP